MRVLPALTSLFLAAGLAGCTGTTDELLRPKPTGCYFETGDDTVHLTAEQTANAATIAAVGIRDGMDEHAVQVAITTVMQESELINVDYGHDDSLGLFQQRPSMGWGTEEELLDPVYASFKFYEKLRRTDGWRDMRLAEAAQAVQVSAYPELYEKWEDEAVVIAAVLAGGQGSGLRCVSDRPEGAVAEAEALADAYAYHWGGSVSGVDGPVVTIAPEDDAAGWNRAAWAVSRAYDHGIASVEYGGLVWVPGEDGWEDPQAEDGETVTAAVGADPSIVTVTFTTGS